MDLIVEPATEQDVPRLVEIQFSAFAGDPFMKALYPGDHSSDEVRASARERVLKRWRADPLSRWCKCVDRGTGTIVGYAIWNLYEHHRPESEWRHRSPVDWCSGRQKEIAENFLNMNRAMREKWQEGRPHLLLGLLCIHKDFQRRGAGTLLVQWGIELARGKGLTVHLEASPDGYHLYRKLGFHQIDTAMVKASDWDGDHDFKVVVMTKEPDQPSDLPVQGVLAGTEA